MRKRIGKMCLVWALIVIITAGFIACSPLDSIGEIIDITKDNDDINESKPDTSVSETTEELIVDTTETYAPETEVAVTPETTVSTTPETTVHTHEYGSWEIKVSPTCIDNGSKERVCTCGEKEVETVLALDHRFVGKKCAVCGYVDYGVADEYLIKTSEDFNKLTNSNETYLIANDIDLSGINWDPIDGFKGTLIGNGFKIKNLTIESTDSFVGFFSTLEGKVTDVIFENASIKVTGSKKCIGILCGSLLEGEFSDISVSGNVVAENSDWVGGIVGSADIFRDCTMENVKNSANVTGDEYVGGVAGWFGGETNYSYYQTTLILKSFSNSGTIKGGSQYVGGIFGCLDSNYSSSSQVIKVDDVTNTGDVSGEIDVGGIVGLAVSNNFSSVIENAVCKANITAEAKVGCIAGRALVVTLNNCSNKDSTLTATKYIVSDGEKYAYVGGIAGIAYLICDSTNYVDINYMSKGYNVGGVVGVLCGIGVGDIQNLENYGNVIGYENVGGIAGYCYFLTDYKDGNEHTITGLINHGTIKATNGWVGGVIGVLDCYKNQLSDIHNYGDVIGTEYVGGIFGWGGSDNRDCTLIDSTCKANISGTAYVGCIAGELSYIAIDSCSNEGSTLTATKYVTVDGVKYAYVGGLVGCGYAASDCTNSVDINYTGEGRYVGGIMGLSTGCYVDQTLYYDTLTNEGEIKGCEYVGGIFGAVIFEEDDWYYTNKYTFTDMKNTANVTGTGDYVGGIFGYFIVEIEGGNGWVYITDANNSGNITGKSYVGGIVGYLTKSTCSSFHGTANSSGIFDPVSTGPVVGSENYGEIYGYSYIAVQ